jgi:hypothetical protein
LLEASRKPELPSKAIDAIFAEAEFDRKVKPMQPTPRKLNTLQKAVLIQVLREFPDQQVCVCYDPSASDAVSYAQDFLTVFTVIGWKVNDGSPSETLKSQPTGLAFVVNGQGELPPSAEALRDALRVYEIEVETLRDPACNTIAGGFILSVGPQA